MSEVEDEKVAPAKDKGKPQQGSKASTAAAPRCLHALLCHSIL